MGSIEERNFWNDHRVKVRPHAHEGWKVDEKHMRAYIECPEFCAVHGEGEHQAHVKECAVCGMVAKLEANPKLAKDAEDSREEAHHEGGPADDEFSVPFKWAVCPTCNGKGSHVNPSVDCGGLTASDFEEDPDFGESYMRGDYDVTCSECGGKRVVPELQGTTPEVRSLLACLDVIEADDADYERTVRAERAMGC